MFALFALLAAAACAKTRGKSRRKALLVPSGASDEHTQTLNKIMRALEPTVRRSVRRHMRAKTLRQNRKANDRLYRMALMTHLGYDASPFLNKRASSHVLVNRLAELY